MLKNVDIFDYPHPTVERKRQIIKGKKQHLDYPLFHIVLINEKCGS